MTKAQYKNKKQYKLSLQNEILTLTCHIKPYDNQIYRIKIRG